MSALDSGTSLCTWINSVQLGLATLRCALPLLLRTALAELPLITEAFCEHLNKRSTTAFLPLWRFGKLARNLLRSTSKARAKSYVPHTHTGQKHTSTSRPQTATLSNRCVRGCVCDTLCHNIFPGKCNFFIFVFDSLLPVFRLTAKRLLIRSFDLCKYFSSAYLLSILPRPFRQRDRQDAGLNVCLGTARPNMQQGRQAAKG